MKSILITGASKGLGLEFTRQYLMKGCRIFGISRHPLDSTELRQLSEKYPRRLVLLAGDVGDENTRYVIFRKINEQTESLDLLINNAGILSSNEETSLGFGSLRQEDLNKTFLINSIAPLMLVQQFIPLLKNGKKPIVANISSANGSISIRGQGGKYSYCASKAALNMITKILSFDLQNYGVMVVALHPGWVKTWMTRNEDAPLEPGESIKGMIEVITSLEMNDSGKFIDWQGNQIPW